MRGRSQRKTKKHRAVQIGARPGAVCFIIQECPKGSRWLGQRFQFRLPDSGAGIAGHTPVAAGRQGDGTDLGAVRQAAALELLHEEAAVEVLQPVQQNLVGVPIAQGGLGQPVDFCGAKTEAEHIVQIEVM